MLKEGNPSMVDLLFHVVICCGLTKIFPFEENECSWHICYFSTCPIDPLSVPHFSPFQKGSYTVKSTLDFLLPFGRDVFRLPLHEMWFLRSSRLRTVVVLESYNLLVCLHLHEPRVTPSLSSPFKPSIPFLIRCYSSNLKQNSRYPSETSKTSSHL